MPDPKPSYAIGIDVGVTNIKCAAINPGGEILSRDTRETHADSHNWPAGIRNLIDKIERERGPTTTIGLSAPGLAAADGNSIAWMQGRLDRVQSLNWSNYLGRAHRVPVLNDAHAAILGETWIGAAREADNAILLTLGTGVGGAILADGRLLRGHLGRAGHLGHISLNPDGSRDIVNTPVSLEDAIGNCTVAARSGGRFNSTHDLIRAHLAGDATAAEIWLRSVKCLAAAIASLVNVVDPQVVIIGGGIAHAGDALFHPLAHWMEQFEWRPNRSAAKIVPAQLGEFAGAIGAARNAMDIK
jgi:glucokinase